MIAVWLSTVSLLNGTQIDWLLDEKKNTRPGLKTLMRFRTISTVVK